ncbi:LysR family transcriptional regulator [Thalassospira profundimaris]|uniref:LysR family transcriptional regulator n=1 Tax=Thalassospira profundimaris TaxID=502049 RepID=A0A367XFR3_9PROT|nr:LysR family transcriptional regulator [Thalassospira profundimaris]RCK51601.1 LysR family transcriptional regulator [Thalassospira profundimaris]
MRGFNLDQLQAFADVVDLGSFSAAAARQNLSQPAISQQVKLLETRLGVRLIERIGKRAMPTPAGQALRAHIGPIDRAIRNALDAVAPFGNGVKGQVRVGCGATACIYFLPAVLAGIQRDYPDLDISVKTGNTGDMIRLIENNELDIGFVTLPLASRALEITPVMKDPFLAIFAADHSVQGPVSPDEMAEMPLVLFEQGSNTRTLVDAWLRKAGRRVHPVMELGSVEAIKELVGAGLGASILPSMAVIDGRSNLPVRGRPLEPAMGRDLAIVMRRDKTLTQGLRVVRDGIIAAANSDLGQNNP